jgi:LytTr DNA-binding domain
MLFVPSPRQRPRVHLLSRPAPRLLLLEVWAALGLVAFAQVAVERVAVPSSFVAATLVPDLWLLGLWAAAVPAILWLVRRFPVSGEHRTRHAAFLAAAGVAFVVLSNIAIRVPPLAPAIAASALVRSTLFGVARFGPAALLVFAVIVALAHRAWAAASDSSWAIDEEAPAPSPTPTARPERVVVREWNRTHLVPPEAIDWITADDNNVVVHAAGKTYKGRGRIRDLEEQLDPGRFARVHRSAIVRVDGVREVQPLGKGDLALVLHCGKTLRVARGRREALARALQLPL